ncbi:MAG: NAD(P)H-dependent oxidoreductase subunit E [Chloroflexi bacterium]|nr:NAD(P)H-dependent oxidoreductase subunit E [Chloroflexota bacterium]
MHQGMNKLTSKEVVERLRPILASHSQERANLVPILQEVQERFSYLPREAMLEVASYLQIPPSSVYGIATFYNQFRLTPLGRIPIDVCLGTACHMRGGGLVMDAFERELGIKVGEITPDGEHSLDRVACIGCCVMAPVAVIAGKIRPRLTPFKVEEVLAEIKQTNPSSDR